MSLDPLREAKGVEVQEAHGYRIGEDITAKLTSGNLRKGVHRRDVEHRGWVAGVPLFPIRKGGEAYTDLRGKPPILDVPYTDEVSSALVPSCSIS